MGSITVVDRPLCGSRGPDLDPTLARFADDLDWLERQGVPVARIDPSSDPEAFLAQSALMPVFQSRGVACLPAFLDDGRVVSTGQYPGRDELARLAGVVPAGEDALSGGVRELVAIAAAVAADCETSFHLHFAEARKLGVSAGEIAQAVAVAREVKDTPAQSMRAVVDASLARDAFASHPAAGCACGCASDAPAPSSGCSC